MFERISSFFVSDIKTQWVKWLPLIEWWYNTPFHIVAKMTPFMALYGYHPPSITSSLRENSKVLAVEDHIEHQQQTSSPTLKGQPHSVAGSNETTGRSTSQREKF